VFERPGKTSFFYRVIERVNTQRGPRDGLARYSQNIQGNAQSTHSGLSVTPSRISGGCLPITMFQVCGNVAVVGFPVQKVYNMTCGDEDTTFEPLNP